MRFLTLNVLFVVQRTQHEHLSIRASKQCSGCSGWLSGGDNIAGVAATHLEEP